MTIKAYLDEHRKLNLRNRDPNGPQWTEWARTRGDTSPHQRNITLKERSNCPFSIDQLRLIKELLLQNNSDLGGFLDMYCECAPATVIECIKAKRSNIHRLIASVVDAINLYEKIDKCENSDTFEEDLPFE